MSLKLPLLQCYILGEVVRVFSFVLGCVTVLLMFVGVFQHATENGLDALETLKMLPYIVPSLLPFTIPAALLLTVSVVYGRMSGDQEVTAAKAAGVHPVSLMWPAFMLGGVLSVFSLVLTDQVIPWSMVKIEQQLITMFENVFLDRLRTELQYDYPQQGLHVTVAAVEGNRLLQPVFRYSRGRRIYTLQAEEASIELDTQNQEIVFHARNCVLDFPHEQRVFIRERTERIRWEREVKRPKPRYLPMAVIDGELETIHLEREDHQARRLIDAAFNLTSADFPKLVQGQAKLAAVIREDNNRLSRLNTEVHSRYAMSCSCFFFALLGTPFSMRFGKSQYLTNFLLCFIPIVCGYYPLMIGLMTQAKKGHLGPEWSMWVANGILAVVAVLVMRRVIRY